MEIDFAKVSNMIDRQKFLSEWFKECEGKIEIRILPSGKQGFFSLDDHQGIDGFAKKHGGLNVYFGAATRNGAGGTKSDIINIPGAWADIDFKTIPQGQADKLLAECPLQPTFIINSGNGYHVYWRFREPTDNLEIVEQINQQIAQYFGGDPVHNADRILRLPDTPNHKYTPWRPVRVVIRDPRNQYNESDFEKHFPALEHTTQSGGPSNPPGWQAEALKGATPGDRHHTATKLVGRHIQKGLSNQEILPILRDWDKRNTPPIEKDYPEGELLRIIESIRKTHDRNHPETPKSEAGLMADLRFYMDMSIEPGQSFTSGQICGGMGAYQRKDKTNIYKYLSRLCDEGIIKKDAYIHGGFRKPLEVPAYDLGSAIQTEKLFDLKLPLDLHNLLKIEPDQLALISGRYDAGKSALIWHTAALNYERHKIIHFSSPEWSINSIKERMDELEIPRPHPNLVCYPMEQGYEDLIPAGPCIVLVDYLRAATGDFSDIDRQFHRILENLHGAVCFAAIQKHPGLDRPIGGQFAVHAPHHVIMLDKLKHDYICKIFKSKGESDLEGVFRTFDFEEGRQLVPRMDTWKKGQILWERPKELKASEINDDSDDKDDNQEENAGNGRKSTTSTNDDKDDSDDKKRVVP